MKLLAYKPNEMQLILNTTYFGQVLLSIIFLPPLLLPPASHRLVKLNERQALVQLGLHQVELC